MIVSFGGRSATILVGRRAPMRRWCMASNLNSENLRAHLQKLHSEADYTRAKANNARLRLMRLSEAAEKLRQQAAVSVQTGRESNARELLFQKKKVMQALEKSKSRIELLDELSVKLNEAISLKETQLVGNVALDLEVGREDASTPVWIVPPKEEVAGNSDGNENLNALNSDEVSQVPEGSQDDLPIGTEPANFQASLARGTWNEDKVLQSLNGVSSYEDFLEHLDQQLNKIEGELLAVLRISALVMEGEEKPKTLRVQQTVDILEGVRQIRVRIASIVERGMGVI